MFDSTIGRFLQRDPIGFAGGDRLLYGYAHESPSNREDPLGLVDKITGPSLVKFDGGGYAEVPTGLVLTVPDRSTFDKLKQEPNPADKITVRARVMIKVAGDGVVVKKNEQPSFVPSGSEIVLLPAAPEPFIWPWEGVGPGAGIAPIPPQRPPRTAGTEPMVPETRTAPPNPPCPKDPGGSCPGVMPTQPMHPENPVRPEGLPPPGVGTGLGLAPFGGAPRPPGLPWLQKLIDLRDDFLRGLERLRSGFSGRCELPQAPEAGPAIGAGGFAVPGSNGLPQAPEAGPALGGGGFATPGSKGR
jgi:hypothetical protein